MNNFYWYGCNQDPFERYEDLCIWREDRRSSEALDTLDDIMADTKADQSYKEDKEN